MSIKPGSYSCERGCGWIIFSDQADPTTVLRASISLQKVCRTQNIESADEESCSKNCPVRNLIEAAGNGIKST